MDEPVTTIDERYSEPDAVATEWATSRHMLEGAQLSWLSTTRPGGGPHVTPVVAVWLDDGLHFMTGDHEQKSANLAADPRVAITTGANDWDRGLDVIVEGTAVMVTDLEVLARLATAWARRWDGRFSMVVREGTLRHLADGELLPHRIDAFRIAATRAYAHAKGTFGHTRYVF
jgi:nitroimidazol reductase NimA-like FMN-containing flavoprotein (pyridoxamine 5'-phosphate oxidase superfamily)